MKLHKMDDCTYSLGYGKLIYKAKVVPGGVYKRVN